VHSYSYRSQYFCQLVLKYHFSISNTSTEHGDIFRLLLPFRTFEIPDFLWCSPNVGLTSLPCLIITRVSSVNLIDFQSSVFSAQLLFTPKHVWQALFTLLITVCFQIFRLVKPQERKRCRAVRDDNCRVSISFTWFIISAIVFFSVRFNITN